MTDGELRTIVETGDALDGSTIQSVYMTPYAFNDAGQIGYFANLTDGRSGIYVASLAPVPEPAGLLALAAAGLVGTWRARRRRAGSVSPPVAGR